MNLKIQHRNLEIPPGLQRVIERKAQKIRRMLPTFSSEILDLHVNIEKLPRGNQFQTSLVLTLPQRAIRVEATEDDLTRSFLRATDELLRRIKRFKSQLNREHFWQRQRVPEGDEVPSGDRKVLESAINAHLDRIENYVRRELYHQALGRDFPAGVIQPQELIDEVFVEVCTNADSRPENVTLANWMFQIARERIQRRLEEVDRDLDQPHLEDSQRSEKDRWEDESLNFYQPDEFLRLEDVIPDLHSLSPEALLAREELEESLHRALARLPKDEREPFVLVVLEGFVPDDVAMMTGRSPDQINKAVDQARTTLRRHLQL